MRKAGTRFRITVQVVNAESEQSVWSERFDRDMVDIFELQDEVSEMVASRIESELGLIEQKKAERTPGKNLGAWDLYQLGVAEFYKFTRESNLKCQELLHKAIERDPEFASAHSRLAYAIVLSMVYFDAAPDDTRWIRRWLRQGAPSSWTTRMPTATSRSAASIGAARIRTGDRRAAAALELNPCLAGTYGGLGDSLAMRGGTRPTSSEIAIRLSPHDPYRWAFYSYRSQAHPFARVRGAVSWARKAVQIRNARPDPGARGRGVGHLGDRKQARARSMI